MARSSLDYKPRHKKPDGWAGSTPRGPHRWARAAANALTNPRSEGAQLYRDRVANADFYLNNYDDADLPFEFRRIDRDNKRDYVTCSLYCAVMQIQLEFSTVDRNEIRRILAGTWVKHYERKIENAITGEVRDMSWTREQFYGVDVLDKSTLRRVARCQCCGTTVSPKK